MIDSMWFWLWILAAVDGFVLLEFGAKRWPWLERWSRTLAFVTAVGVLAAIGDTIIPKGVIW